MSTVEYLAPGAATWTERTTENTEDLIADPFWRLKQASVASKDAILIRCGAGFIKRSTDGGENWTTVTPTTNPPNDAADSPAPLVANVTFNQLDGSLAIQDEFVALVTWQNTSSQWRTWLYHTDDSFATAGSWLSITGRLDDFSWNALDLVAGGPVEGRFVDAKSSFFHHNRSIIKLTNTKMVVHYIGSNPSDPVVPGFCKIIDIQTDGTLSIGSEQGPYTPFTDPDWNEVGYGSIFTWSSTKFALVTNEFDFEHTPTGTDKALIRLCTVSGSTIIFGPSIVFGIFGFGNSWIDAFVLKLPGANSDGLFVYTGHDAVLNEWPGFARIISEGVSTFTLRTEYQWEVDNSPGVAILTPVVFDDTYAAIFYNIKDDVGDGVFRIYGKTITITGFVLAFTPNVLIVNADSGQLAADRLTSTKAILVYYDDAGAGAIKSVTISRSGTVLSAEDTQTVSTTYLLLSSVRSIGISKWAVFYEGTGSDYTIAARIASLTGTYTHAYGTEQTLNNEPTNELLTTSGQFASSKFIISYMEDEEDPGFDFAVHAVTGSLDDGFEVKGLGISMGKGLGNRIWITAWTSAEGLVLLDIDLFTFTEVNRFSLGMASESEVASKTWIAYPYGIFGSDDAVAVFGRMDGPQGLASPEHIIYTGNGGSSFSSIENSWLINHCGSIYYLANGDLYAIRNDGAATRLYLGTLVSAMVLKSILPLPAGVDPHGMNVDPFSLNLVACSNVPGAVMVVQSLNPYSTWSDLTLDHQTAEGVNAVAIL